MVGRNMSKLVSQARCPPFFVPYHPLSRVFSKGSLALPEYHDEECGNHAYRKYRKTNKIGIRQALTLFMEHTIQPLYKNGKTNPNDDQKEQCIVLHKCVSIQLEL